MDLMSVLIYTVTATPDVIYPDSDQSFRKTQTVPGTGPVIKSVSLSGYASVATMAVTFLVMPSIISTTSASVCAG